MHIAAHARRVGVSGRIGRRPGGCFSTFMYDILEYHEPDQLASFMLACAALLIATADSCDFM